eukprot:640631-Pyramimonas_sp.AAC.1
MSLRAPSHPPVVLVPPGCGVKDPRWTGDGDVNGVPSMVMSMLVPAGELREGHAGQQRAAAVRGGAEELHGRAHGGPEAHHAPPNHGAHVRVGAAGVDHSGGAGVGGVPLPLTLGRPQDQPLRRACPPCDSLETPLIPP